MDYSAAAGEPRGSEQHITLHDTSNTTTARARGTKCEHGRVRSVCQACGGGSVCEHGRVRSRCKACGGGSVCEHGRVRSRCKACGGGRLP